MLCANGTGDDCLDYNDEVNSYTQNMYNRTASYVPVNNCGTRIFSHGNATQTSTIDVKSGLSTNYIAE